MNVKRNEIKMYRITALYDRRQYLIQSRTPKGACTDLLKRLHIDSNIRRVPDQELKNTLSISPYSFCVKEESKDNELGYYYELLADNIFHILFDKK